MASAIVFFIYACALLPLLAAWKERQCVFPFIFEGMSYDSCTRDGSKEGRLWCATTPNYDSNPQWKWCATQEYGGNSGGKPCVLPFTYLMETYYTCTTKNSDKPWCATTGSYDRKREWSYCADTRRIAGPCVFPFKYNNTSHTTCVTGDSPDEEPWCSLTKDYDEDHQRVPCEASESVACYFPFIYKGKYYYSCTRDGTIDGQLWCATTPSYDKSKKWRTCIIQEFGGNSYRKDCYFPFIYKEKIYYNCTNVDEPSGRLWCATTPSYDKDPEWTFCADPASPEEGLHHNGTCKFPFTYKGTTYSHCTKDGSIWRRFWCSLTSNYDEDPKWKYCDSSDIEKGCSQQS